MLCADMVGSGGKTGPAEYGRRPASGDISASGACLQLETPCRWRRRSIGISQQVFAGRVRYCVYREIGYFIGVEFRTGIEMVEGDVSAATLAGLAAADQRGKNITRIGAANVGERLAHFTARLQVRLVFNQAQQV